MDRREGDRWPYLFTVVYWLVFAVFCVCVASVSGCATIDAVTAAPPDFWMTVEDILWAMWQDVSSLIDLLL